MAISDATYCNWVSYHNALSMHTFFDVLLCEILEKYTEVDYDVKCLMTNPDTKLQIIFLPDMPHLTKKYYHIS